MSNTQNPSIRFECDEQDKALARAIGQRNGGTSMSATLRRLIREEADRLQISCCPQTDVYNPGAVLLPRPD